MRIGDSFTFFNSTSDKIFNLFDTVRVTRNLHLVAKILAGLFRKDTTGTTNS